MMKLTTILASIGAAIVLTFIAVMVFAGHYNSFFAVTSMGVGFMLGRITRMTRKSI